VGLAALLLYVILRLQGGNLPKFGAVWKHFAIVGFFSNALPFVLFSWGEQYIDSAFAAILNGTTPLFTIVLAHFFISDDRMTLVKAMGTLLGFGGLILLISPSFAGGVQLTTWGLLAATMAAFCYGIAIVYTRNNLRGLPRLVAPTAQLTMATLYMLPLSLIIEQPFRLPFPSWSATGSLIALAVLGTALAFVIYYYLLERTSATYISMVTYLAPVIGVALGVAILDEHLDWTTYAGCGLILIGVMVVNGVFKSISFRRTGNAAARP
jgi:drug/metabolite transporter (DMT)-like permease